MTSRPAAGRDRGQPGVGEGALVLAGLVGERPVLERPVAGPGRRRSGRRRRPRPIRRRRTLLFAPWNAASWWTIRSVPGRHVRADERRLDGPGELAADRALEVGPHLERHRGVGLAEWPGRRRARRASGWRRGHEGRGVRPGRLPPRTGSAPRARRSRRRRPTAVIQRSGERHASVRGRGRTRARCGVRRRARRAGSAVRSVGLAAQRRAPVAMGAAGARGRAERCRRRDGSIDRASRPGRGPSGRSQGPSGPPAAPARRLVETESHLLLACRRHELTRRPSSTALDRAGYRADRAAPVARGPDRRSGRALHRRRARGRGARPPARGRSGDGLPDARGPRGDRRHRARRSAVRRARLVGCEPVHHHHVICSRCGRTTEIDDAGLRPVVRDVARQTGFRVDDHRLELFGLCPACQAAPARPDPITA